MLGCSYKVLVLNSQLKDKTSLPKSSHLWHFSKLKVRSCPHRSLWLESLWLKKASGSRGRLSSPETDQGDLSPDDQSRALLLTYILPSGVMGFKDFLLSQVNVTDFCLFGKAFHIVGLLTTLFLHVRKPVFTMLIKDVRELKKKGVVSWSAPCKRGALETNIGLDKLIGTQARFWQKLAREEFWSFVSGRNFLHSPEEMTTFV